MCKEMKYFCLYILFYCIIYVNSEESDNKELNLNQNRRETIFPLFGTTQKCIKEIPTEFLRTSVNEEPLHGNGSHPYLSRIETCCDGYKEYEHNSSICVPDCGNKCANGICVAPNNCECFPSFIKIDSGECVTTCPLGCLNGKCYSNGTCECLDKNNFELNSDRTFCKPKCSQDCNKPHQNCTAPDQCSCEDGYKYNFRGNCVPACKANCNNHGKCIQPNVCKCDPGFILKDGVCQSQSEKNWKCINGYINDDNECKCFEGYSLKIPDGITGICLPVCDFHCMYGVCVAPNQCKCFNDNFNKLNNKGSCLPVCNTDCCVKPGICDCKTPRLGPVKYSILKNITPGRYCIT